MVQRALPPPAGVRALPDGVALDIDCSGAGITNIHGVTRLLGALFPSVDTPEPIRVPESLQSIDLARNTSLTFGSGGNALLFLGYGWSEPEPWGVWSLGRSCEVVLLFLGQADRPIDLRVEGRLLVYGGRPRSRGAVVCAGRRIGEFEATLENAHISLDLSVRPKDLANGELVIGFETEMPWSPAEEGIGNDTRRLGFGLEELEIKGGLS